MLQTDPALTPTVVPDSISAATGVDWAVLRSMSVDDLLNLLVHYMVDFCVNVAIAIVVFYVGKWIIRKLYTVVKTILIRRRVDRSLSTFVLSLIRIVLYFILIVTVIGIIGINTTSFLAIFASAGVAIGMALSGTLQNFAGGVLILLLKPYKIGDYIEAQGYAGTVTEIQIFHTIICTPDNKSIIIPNGGLSTGTINNWSREDYRRVQWTVSISYGDDVAKAREVILDIVKSDPRTVQQYIEDDREMRLAQARVAGADEACPDGDPDCLEQEKEERHSWLWRLLHRGRQHVQDRIEGWEEKNDARIKTMLTKTDRSPVVMLAELADSSVNLTVRAWTQSGSYWGLFFDVNEKIYNRLPQEGISFPFPQMDVHMKG